MTPAQETHLCQSVSEDKSSDNSAGLIVYRLQNKPKNVKNYTCFGKERRGNLFFMCQENSSGGPCVGDEATQGVRESCECCMRKSNERYNFASNYNLTCSCEVFIFERL
jgi:hypothetical protein